MKLAGKTDVGSVRSENQDDYRAGELNSDAAWGLVCKKGEIKRVIKGSRLRLLIFRGKG